ncbi:MAG: Hsp20/alpha crystallin family protein [Bacteroidetes bacterium]|nr:Hsp20/alpha crystallin family protein [Bacteroidota bacterium]
MKNLNSIPAIALAPHFYDSFFLKDSLNNGLSSKRRFTNQPTEYPAVNIQSNENGFVVELAAPGLNKEKFNIQFNQDKLTISYKQEEQNETAQVHYSLQEYSLRSFSRSFTFQKQLIDEDNITAEYQNGILRLELPKRESAKPKAPKQITIA